MTRGINLGAMRAAVRRGKIEWQRHALERMAERGIIRRDVKEVLLKGERIENYPDDYTLPSALLLGRPKDRPLHVVVAFRSDVDTVFVITAYEPSVEYFEPDFQTRRKKR